MSLGPIARGARPGSPGAEQTASSTAVRAVTVNCMPAGTYTAPGDASSNTVERPPMRSKTSAPPPRVPQKHSGAAAGVGGPRQADHPGSAAPPAPAANWPGGEPVHPEAD